MEILKSKMAIALIVMILGASYIGGLDNNTLEDNQSTNNHPISINA